MIIVLKPLSPKEDIERVENMVKARGLDTHVIEGAEMTIIGCIGDTSRIDAKLFEVDPAVTKVMHVQEPYKLASRAFHPDNSIIDVSGVKVGGDNLALIAGPCSVESVDQVLEIAKAAKASGANMLRGGAFKPRTSPYSFQGLGLEGLNILCEAKAATEAPARPKKKASISAVFNPQNSKTNPGSRRQAYHTNAKTGEARRPAPAARPAQPAKPAAPKPAEVKAAEVKPAEVKATEVKAAEVKPAETKTAEVKTTETKTDQEKPEVKTEDTGGRYRYGRKEKRSAS